jgi:hypothetical protein
MKKRPISYTGRDFASIKKDLTNYAERYYASTFRDFNEASFGAMMLDLVSYVGDQMSFYLDYQANESFIDSAIEYQNIVRLAQQMGYKMPGAASAVGTCAFYVVIPANPTTGKPDLNYTPILRKGTLLTADSGATYTLNENVFFSKIENEITVAKVDQTTGVPTDFAIKSYGQVISGQLFEKTLEVGDYERFLRLNLKTPGVIEIISVTDSQGNEYFEVEHLSQDIVLEEAPNYSSSKDVVQNIMKVRPVARRYVTEFDQNGNCFLQFGFGSAGNLTTELIADPADVVLDVTGRKYITDNSFDPSNLIKTDKFGVVPTNTTLTVVYRANNLQESNAPVSTVSNISSPLVSFENRDSLVNATINSVIASFEVENEDPILGDVNDIAPDEIRERASATFATQNRAVTRSDYVSLCYRMPSRFGKIKRVNIEQDGSELNRNLNLYVLSENNFGDFVAANETIKNNLRTWLSQYRMLNDTVDILNGKVINYGINFEIIADLDVNKYDVLNRCIQRIIDDFTVKGDIGEALYISEIYKALNDVPGVVDAVSVGLVNKTGPGYSDYYYNIEDNLSDDGRYLIVPANAVAEILNPQQDITGVVR